MKLQMPKTVALEKAIKAVPRPYRRDSIFVVEGPRNGKGLLVRVLEKYFTDQQKAIEERKKWVVLIALQLMGLSENEALARITPEIGLASRVDEALDLVLKKLSPN